LEKGYKCEISALESNQTWDIILLPKNKTVIGYKWVFKIKYNVDGTVERYKTKISGEGIHTNRGH